MSAHKWLSRLQTKVTKCENRQPDRWLTEKFIVGLNANDMTDEILREFTTLKNIEEPLVSVS